MSSDNRKNPIVVLNMNNEEPENAQKTFVCFGVPRGGTSAVAGTLQRLGVPMGPKDLPNNYEDPNFLAGKSPKHMWDTIEARNAEYDVWGWKFPNAANYLEGFLSGLRNPHLVVVWRDLAATMKAHVRWHGREQTFATHEILLQQQRNMLLVDRWNLPTAHVSYEKAILSRNVFVHNMADFLGVDRPEGDDLKALSAFLAPGSYK